MTRPTEINGINVTATEKVGNAVHFTLTDGTEVVAIPHPSKFMIMFHVLREASIAVPANAEAIKDQTQLEADGILDDIWTKTGIAVTADIYNRWEAAYVELNKKDPSYAEKEEKLLEIYRTMPDSVRLKANMYRNTILRTASPPLQDAADELIGVLIASGIDAAVAAHDATAVAHGLSDEERVMLMHMLDIKDSRGSIQKGENVDEALVLNVLADPTTDSATLYDSATG